ncbi:PWWP domain protein [Aspergillus saccharolyticus JOP 1030-1]|uniref:PWWP domain-containing protein n=1 Tax=Aspergillus saccharolyticus JOP 1030-1 TaxID=1450539 RepID=A0A318ZQG0_9EURO|nr:hypothetical protein BP01DRAFT_364794 [Aspergillus saccharolyticus JOP 1030-1]PYH46633.1 hypothetical protein BP01DRAFT_364794 [Aspergillus saccharolyticus JOP 1030-1]
MAEESPASAPAPDAAESVERAPAETQSAPVDAAPGQPKETVEKEANGSDEKASEPASSSEEKKESTEAEKPATSSEPVDAKEPADGAAAPAEPEVEPAPTSEANGTPASAKKSSSSRRKSTGGSVSRKKSQPRVTHLDAKPGDYFLARLRSYPPWPSIICDEEMLPRTLLDTRPVTAQREDGTIRDDYAKGGKRAHERTFPVMFFETNEFAWVPNTDLTPLDPAACKEVSEKGKTKLLLSAYAVGAEGHDLQYFKELLVDHQRALEQETEEKEAQAAAKAAAKAAKEAKKSKRKSMDVVEDDDVEMEDADEEEHKPKSSKKRKKDAEADVTADEKPAKTPKTTKLKLTTPKTPTTENGKKAPASSKAKQTTSSKKAGKAAASDEGEDSRPASKEPEKKVNQEELKEKKEKEVLFIRHKLQKGFISRELPPAEEEMTAMSGYFTKLEKHTDLEVSIIRATKINKVLKMIVKLSSIPRDEEFQFRQRAINILSKWKNVLDADTTGPSEHKEKEDKPRANGVHKESSVETPVKADTENEKEEDSKESKTNTAEPQDEPMTDADAGDKSDVPEPAKEDAEQPTSKADETPKEQEEEKTDEEKPAAEAEKTEEKTAEAVA